MFCSIVSVLAADNYDFKSFSSYKRHMPLIRNNIKTRKFDKVTDILNKLSLGFEKVTTDVKKMEQFISVSILYLINEEELKGKVGLPLPLLEEGAKPEIPCKTPIEQLEALG